MTSRRRMGIAVVLTLAPLAARSQEINLSTLDDGSPNRIHVRTGAEHAFVFGVGYARAVPFLDRRLLLHGDVSLPWAELDISDYRVRAGALAPIVGTGGWKVAGDLAPTLRGTDDRAGRMTNLGLDAGLLGGYYARHWFVAGEVGFDWAISTYVAHSDRYREQVYADARDGWYGDSGGNVRVGLQTGASFGLYDLVLRAGAVRDVAGEPPLLPLYATLALDRRW